MKQVGIYDFFLFYGDDIDNAGVVDHTYGTSHFGAAYLKGHDVPAGVIFAHISVI